MNQAFIQNAISGVMAQATVTGLFASLATFEYPQGTQDQYGVPSGPWAPCVGLSNIPCMDAPQSDMRINATETREMPEITATALRHVLLDSYYAAVADGWRGDPTGVSRWITGAWRVVIDGVAYDIQGVERDSQSQMTRITAKLSTV